MRFQTLDVGGLAAALAAEKRPFVLDVRSRGEFEAGHLPGAHNVPVHEMARRMRDLPAVRIARILVVGEPGKRSEAAVTWLVLMGYADVALVEGGIAAYAGALETGAAPAPPARGPELRVIS